VTLKPFAGTRGFKSHPVERSQQPERVLRRGAVTIPAKRRQPVQKPCDTASKAPIWEPSFWIRRGPRRRHRKGQGASVRTGSKSRADAWEGSSGTWEVLSSPAEIRQGESRSQTPGPPDLCLGRVGAKHRGTPTGIANRRKRRAAKGMAGWLSVLVVPMKRGNSNPRGPRGGKEKPEGDAWLWTCWKET